MSAVFKPTTSSAAASTRAILARMKSRSINSPMERKKTTRRMLWIGSITGITRLRSVELPTMMPARNAPYTGDKPARPDRAAAEKHKAREPMASRSTLSSIALANGSLSFGLRPNHHNKPASSATATTTLKATSPRSNPSPPRLETRISIGTTAMSCAISTPTATRPGALRNSPISSSIFIATTVLDSAMMKPRMSVSDGLAFKM